MAQRPDIDPIAQPPRLARFAISHLAPHSLREALLGDLDEGFHDQASTSEKAARRWYWHQAFISVPALAGMQLKSQNARTVWLVIASTLAGLVLISFWDVNIARRSAYILSAQPDAPGLIFIRAVYFLIQTVGFTLCGAGIARLAFRPDWHFRRNCLACLGPFLIWLVASGIHTAMNYQPVIYHLFQSSLCVAGLIGGAYIADRTRRKT